jgi:hypothetical protein
MPLLSYHSALPLDLWDLLASSFKTMAGLLWYLYAFLASTSLFNGNNAEGVAAQYLLGLGESFKPVPNHRISIGFQGIGDITGYFNAFP